jgi:ABC-2 type transport system permease protein
MRWVLIKDLQILKRSPLLVALLVVYPVIVALLVGVAFSRGPERPTIAVVNQLPPGEKLTIGNRTLNLLDARSAVFDRVHVLEVRTREDAIDKVKQGEALAALIIPEDLVRKLETGFLAERPQLQVFVNEEDPLKKRLVDDTITSLVAEANKRVSREFTDVSLNYLDLVLKGGTLNLLGQKFHVLGLDNVERISRAASAKLPAGAPERRELGRVVRFTELAREGFDLTDEVLASVSEPIRVDKQVLSGEAISLTRFAAAVTVAMSLMFVAVLLAAGSLALERSENAFDRLIQSSLTRTTLIVEKVLLAAACSAAVTLLMLLGLGIFIPLEWSRFALWLAGLAVASAAFAAMGVAIGGLAREVSVASLFAFALLLPVTFLALVPAGVVSDALYDLTRAISALFPFRPTVKLMSSALYGEGGAVAPLVHLAVLAIAFAAAGRLALRRFAQ